MMQNNFHCEFHQGIRNIKLNFRFPFDSFAATKWGGTVSVGSSSKLADGATAAVMANESGIK